MHTYITRQQRQEHIETYMVWYKQWHQNEPTVYDEPSKHLADLLKLNNSELLKVIGEYI